MSDARRSTRVRKAVNYSKLCVDDSDDDFKDESPTVVPQNKRKKIENSPQSEISKKDNKIVIKEAIKTNKEETYPSVIIQKLSPKPARRIPVSEKVLARDLHQAIELSKQSVHSTEQTGKEKSEGECDDAWNKSSASEDEEESDWSENETETKKTTNKSVKPKAKTIPIKSVAEVKAKKPSPVPLKKTPNPKPSTSLQSANNSLKIPVSGLRLGLSRKAFVKSLHPVVKVQQ